MLNRWQNVVEIARQSAFEIFRWSEKKWTSIHPQSTSSVFLLDGTNSTAVRTMLIKRVDEGFFVTSII
jgi:hypothetical protein